MKMKFNSTFIRWVKMTEWITLLTGMLLLCQCSDSHTSSDLSVYQIENYHLKGPIIKKSCLPEDTITAAQEIECLEVTYDEALEMVKENPGWDIPDIDDWENIISLVIRKDIEEVRDQSFFTGASPSFSDAIGYENQFHTYNIWVKGKLTARNGDVLRRSLSMQNGGPNEKNLIIMGNPIEMGDESFDPVAVLYLVKNDLGK